MVEEMTLEDTVDLMLSMDWEDRFLAEYYQAKIRYKKLREVLKTPNKNIPPKAVHLLSLQEATMAAYIGVLEERAKSLGMDLAIGKAA